MLALAALMVSCVAELDTTPEVDITTVRCTISRIDVEEDFATGILDTLTATKATFSNSNFLWSAGDKIGIVPNTGAQIYFEVDNGAGTSTASFDGGDWAMKSTGTFYAYYPLYPDIFLSKDHVSVSYTGQTQSGNNNNLHTGDYWTLYTEGTTAVGNALNFSFNHLTSFFKTYVTVPAGTYTKITFSAPTEVFIKDGYFDLSAQTPTIVGTTMTDELCLDLQNVTFADETELTGYLVLAPVDITGVPITVTVYKDGEPAYEYTLTKANPMVAAKTYAFRATSLTQLAASAEQANALYAAGATSVSITEPLTEDMAIVLPNTSEAVTLILPTTASTSTLTVSYPQNAASYPATVTITGPEGADLNIQTPNSTVTINGTAYDQITSRTATNTCIISAGVTVNVLKVIQGGVQVYGTVSQIDLSEQEDEAIIKVSGTVTSLLGEDDEEYSPVTGIALNRSSINLSIGNTETLTATVAPVGAYPKVIWTSSNETVATVSASGVVSAVAAGSATITATTVYGGFVATCNVSVTSTLDYVDLGLPSGLKWATRNLGANGFVNSPEDWGDYFAWGETEPYYSSYDFYSGAIWKDDKSGYNWESYKWSNEAGDKFTKYCLNPGSWDGEGDPDMKVVLDPEDDAASVILGGNWRMPTFEEWIELYNYCDWEFEWGNAIVTSRINGNHIYLPQGGDFRNTTKYSSDLYWSSTLIWSDSARDISLSSIIDSDYSSARARFCGLNIRPVYGQNISIPMQSVSLNESSLSLKVGQSANLIATVTPSNTTQHLIFSSSNTSVVNIDITRRVLAVGVGSATITAQTRDGSVSAICTVTVSEATISSGESIDLGLPSGLKWASCNLCENGFVDSPDEYGDYYAWGETEPYYLDGHSQDNPCSSWKDGKLTGYNEESYQWFQSNGDNYLILKYDRSIDHKIVLEPSDDVAHVKLGYNWHIPTYDEWKELIDNCTWISFTLNGIPGCLITSNLNGNTIFLPAAGDRLDAQIRNINRFGEYLSASLGDNSWNIKELSFLNYKTKGHISESAYRYCGRSVRPVTE